MKHFWKLTFAAVALVMGFGIVGGNLYLLDRPADAALTAGEQRALKNALGSKTHADAIEAMLEKVDDVTAGTVSAGDAVVVDANKDVSQFRNLGVVKLSSDADDTTDGVVDVMDLSHTSSDNNATAGDGIGISFELENATGTSTVEEHASFDVVSTTITDGSEDTDGVFSTMLAGTVTEAFRLDSSDQSLTLGRNATDANGVNKLRIFPLTASKGSLTITAADSAGDTVTDLTIASQAAARTYTIPDAGANAFVQLNTGFAEVLKVADVDVSSAELLALNATPKTLISAPGAGVGILLHKVCIQLDFATTAYDGIAAGENLVIETATTGTDLMLIETATFLAAAADETRCFVASTDGIGTASEGLLMDANEAVELQLLVGEIATGDSPLDVRVWYWEVTLELP